MTDSNRQGTDARAGGGGDEHMRKRERERLNFNARKEGKLKFNPTNHTHTRTKRLIICKKPHLSSPKNGGSIFSLNFQQRGYVEKHVTLKTVDQKLKKEKGGVIASYSET